MRPALLELSLTDDSKAACMMVWAGLQVVHDLAGWKVRSIACGAGTYALAAGVPGEADNSTVTW